MATLISFPRPEGRRISSLIRLFGFLRSTSLMVNANSIDSTKARSGALSRASLMAAVMLFSMMPHLCGLRGVRHLSRIS